MTLDISAQPGPEPDDLAGWKAVDRRLTQRITEWLKSSGLVTRALLQQYFGCRHFEYLLEEYDQALVFPAFVEWLVNDYRPVLHQDKKKMKDKNRRRLKTVRRGKTVAEKMLASHMPQDEAQVLAACSQAHPSLFRVTDVQIGSTLTVQDILTGVEYVVHDRSLSESVTPTRCLPGRVYRAGGFHFFAIAGPAMPLMLAWEAREYLQALGVGFTEQGLRQGADKFGLLWDWYDEQVAGESSTELLNTDGHELVWQTASFSVSDENLVRQALDEREDVDYDQKCDDYHWIREQKTGETYTQVLNLGRLYFVCGELILEVNSFERLEAARVWIEKIPGVAFLAANSRKLSPGPTDIPLDDQLGSDQPVEATPELVEHVQTYLRQYYMDWLDIPLPALGGKTPRQACQTEPGQTKVAQLIRAIPTPGGNHPITIEALRKDLLKELGLA